MENFTEEVSKFIGTVTDKAKYYGGIAKLQAQIKAEEAKKYEQYHRLGKKYYELYKDAPASDLADLMKKLTDMDDKIAELKRALEEAQAAANVQDASDAAEDVAEAAADAVDKAADAVADAAETVADAVEDAVEVEEV